METVATFDNQIDASLALGRLAAEGIEGQLVDQNLVQMDILYNIAVGGIKLQVEEREAARARALLDDDYSDLLEPGEGEV